MTNSTKNSFLISNNIDTTSGHLIGQDTSSRRYFRYNKNTNKQTVLLMESIPDHHPESMNGHKTKDFVYLSNVLREYGIHTPEIYAEDHEHGLLLLEDFGSLHFKQKAETNQQTCYEIATDVLLHIKEHLSVAELNLPNYFESPVYQGKRRIIDWYFPALHQTKHPVEMVDSYNNMWKAIEESLPVCEIGFCHVDFHFENLMWIEHANGLNKCGVIDFQGAMKGPTVYDLTNLLEDARVIVPETIRSEMFERYCKHMNKEIRERTELWYRVVATQFHCRVLGQFFKIALILNRPEYLKLIPNILHYLNLSKDHPILQPLYEWFKENDIVFDREVNYDLNKLKKNIHDNAF